MKIVLSGVETNNKGAELMLYAILQEIERRYPEAVVYVEPDSILQGFQYIKTSLTLKDKPVAYVRRFARKIHLFSVLKLLKISWLPFEDIYAVRDADFFLNDSGYSIADKWKITEYELQMREALYKNQAKQGTRIVFLPQAFGPVELDNTKKNLALLNKYADAVMAREIKSYDYLNASHLIDMRKVHIWPDFTSLVQGYFPISYNHLKGGVCIIPNVRMLDMESITYNKYRDFIQCIIEVSREHGDKPYLLNHEGEADGKLAQELQRDIDCDIEVVDNLNALEIKGLISTAKLVVTSRFHGVASALNSCVPCLATSWSHKYAELFRDYHQDECVLDPRDIEDVRKKIQDYLSPEKNAAIRKELSQVLPSMQDKAREMWDYVWSLN